MSTAFAQLPIQRRTIDAPVSNKEQATLETTRVLFFAHDTVTDQEKRELSFKEWGGIHLPHIAGLRDSNYMLYRCRLTQLPPFKMIGDWDMMLPPEARQEGGRWQRSFTQTVIDPAGQPKDVLISGFLESNVTEEGEFKNKRFNGMLFTKRYPMHEARQAIKRSGPHTTGGVVDIEALMGATTEEIGAAQLFFFPAWPEIARGEAQLPRTTKELEAHLKARVDAIKDMPWEGTKKAKYYSIGKDMIRSSTEYNRTAMEAIRQDEKVSKSAFTMGNTEATSSVISDQYLEQTGSRRKEDVLTGQVNDVAALTHEMREERKAAAERDARSLLLEERKQYVAEVTGGFREKDETEEIRLGLKKAPIATSGYAAVEPVVDVPSVLTTTPMPDNPVVIDVGEPQIETVANGMKACGKLKANNEPCERQIDVLADGCFQHSSSE